METLISFLSKQSIKGFAKVGSIFTLLVSCLMVHSALANSVTRAEVPQVSVNMGEKISFHSKNLNEQRDFFVRLPNGYHETKRDYPVIYLLDANNETLTYMKDLYFHSVNQIERLMSRGDIPQSIIVGIPFTSAQWFSNVVGNAEPFRNYLTEELTQYINDNYRTLNNRLLVGQSYSAVFVINALTKNPASFSNYVAIEPVLASGAMENAIKNYQNMSVAEATLHIIMGGAIMLHEAETLVSAIEKENIEALTIQFETFGSESHRSAYYPALNSALRKHFSDYRQPDIDAILSANIGYQQLLSYYQKRTEKYQVLVTDKELQSAIFDTLFNYLKAQKFEQAFALWPKWQSPYKSYNANRIINHFFRTKDYDAAIAMLGYIIKEMPLSVSSVDQLATAYQLNNQSDLAERYHQQVKQLLNDIFAQSVNRSQEASLNRYGYRLLHEKRIEQAVSLFEELSHARAESINALDSLSDAYVAAGNYPKAITTIEKALSIAKTQENINTASFEQKLSQFKKQITTN